MTTIDLTEKFEDTDLTYGDLISVGAALLDWSAAARLARHASPVGTTEYAEVTDFGNMIVRDFATWCAGHDPAARRKILTFLHRIGWADMVQREAGSVPLSLADWLETADAAARAAA